MTQTEMPPTAVPSVKFGREARTRPPFAINELEFRATPLSLSEEQQLAGVGASAAEREVLPELLEVLAALLNARHTGDEAVDVPWLMDNLMGEDLEGIVAYLRGETPQE